MYLPPLFSTKYGSFVAYVPAPASKHLPPMLLINRSFCERFVACVNKELSRIILRQRKNLKDVPRMSKGKSERTEEE